MKLTDFNTKLAHLEEDTWHYIEAGRDHSNDITGVKIEENWVFVKYIGGDFEKDFTMKFEYSQRSLNEIWQYDFQEDYTHPIDKNIDDLNWVIDIATIPYNMCNDTEYKQKYTIVLN